MTYGPSYEQEQAFLLALGEAIAKWQNVESASYTLFQELFKGADHRLVSLAFHHRQSFESKIDLLEKCAYFAFSKNVHKEWTVLFKRLKRQVAIRNRLVHSKYHTGSDGGKPTVSLGPSYMDAQYAINDKWKNSELTIDADRLKQAKYDFDELARDIHQFFDNIQQA